MIFKCPSSITSSFLRIKYTGVDPRILVLDDNYVKEVYHLRKEVSVKAIINVILKLQEKNFNESSNEL